MKIKVNYGSSASINTGVQYEAIKPFYNAEIECEIPDTATVEEVKKAVKDKTEELKSIIDPMLFKDMKEWNCIRTGPKKQSECKCLPTWDQAQNKYVHADYCLAGTARPRITP